MLSFQAIFAEFKRDCIVRSALALFFLVLPLDLLGALQYIVVKAFFASTRDATVAEIQRGVVQIVAISDRTLTTLSLSCVSDTTKPNTTIEKIINTQVVIHRGKYFLKELIKDLLQSAVLPPSERA